MFKIYKLNSSPVIDFAAEELKKYMRMMMPRCGEIAIERKPDAADGFRLGLMQDFGLDVSEAKDVELGEMNLDHLEAYAKELEAAGATEAGVSPMLLPNYARHER